MASNLRVDTILPSTGTTLGIGTASGTINFLGNSNITTTGTISAASLSVTGSINAASATITGNLGVGGVLTYEDVTNVDSVGLITARSGLNVSGGEVKVGTAVTVSSGGVITSGVVTATSYDSTVFSKIPTNTPAFHAWSNNVTSHSIADATFTKVTFLNSETLDTDNAYDNATSGTTANRFTVPSGKGGFYQVNAGLNFYANLNDIRGIIARIQQNGATKITQYGFISSYAAGTRHFQVNLGGVLSLAAGDYIELSGWLDTNGNSQGYFSNDANGYRGNYFSAFKLII